MDRRLFNKLVLGSVLGTLVDKTPFVAAFGEDVSEPVRIAAWNHETLFWAPAVKLSLREDRRAVIFQAAGIDMIQSLEVHGMVVVNEHREVIKSTHFNRGPICACSGDTLKLTYSVSWDGPSFDALGPRLDREPRVVKLEEVRDAYRYEGNPARITVRDYHKMKALVG